MLTSREKEIMKLLLENGRMYFAEITRKLHSNRNKTHDRLTRLTGRGLIEEENWKPGRKKWFKLTSKGETELAHAISADLNKASRTLKDLSGKTLNDQQFWKEFAEETRQSWFEFRASSEPLKERIAKLEARMRRPYSPLVESYKNIHEMIARILRSSHPHLKGKRLYYGVTKKGRIDVVTEDMIRTKRFPEKALSLTREGNHDNALAT